MQKSCNFFLSRTSHRKIRKQFTQVSYDKNYYHEFFRISQMNYLPKKGEKRKLKNLPLLTKFFFV